MTGPGADRVVAVVPARGGSKGIPMKNIKPLLGKPLLAWTVEAAQASGVCSRIIVSTDDERLAEIGRSCGAEVPFLRPAELAQDDTPMAPVIRHAVEWLRDHAGERPEVVMVLEPTSPARRPFHIREAAALFGDRAVESVASVSTVPHHYAPMKQLRLHADGTLTGLDGSPLRRMIHRRQELPIHYAFNGLIFACRAAVVLREQPPTLWGDRVAAYLVDARYCVDIDTPEDWVLAEHRLRRLLEGAEEKHRYVASITERYGNAQTGLTQEFGKSWQCACREDPSLACGHELVDCLHRHGQLLGGGP